ncbi:MAG: transglutaminase-like domain-containing protein [Chitinophagaceae bacterium]
MLSIPYRPDDREISAGQRVLRTDGAKYNNLFPPAKSEDKVVFEDGEVDDTLRLMERVIHSYIDDTKPLAQHLRKVNTADTIKSIWDFLYHNIQYKLDKQGLEQLRRPARSWADRQSGIDCDCFAIFCSSILVNLGIQHSLRVTRYSQPTWQHVYVVIPKDGKSISNGYWTIDAVLARPDYEKSFTAKKDYKMSLSGINIAVLSGPDTTEGSNSPLTAMDVLMGFDDATSIPIGSTGDDINGAHYEHELYKFLIATRQTIEAAPEAFIQATGGNPSDTIRMLDYAIQYWYTDKRDEALGYLEKNEETLNTLAGFGAFNAVQITGANEAELYGDDDAHEIAIAGLGRAKGKQKKPSKFFSGIKKAVKKVNIGKALMRFNPATIAIRNGFLLALKLNIGKMSEKMKWAYATPQQASAKRVSPAKVAAAKRAVAKVEKMFTKLGGKGENMRKAILHAKKGHLNGLGQLGILPLAAGLAAALPFIKIVMDVLKKSGLTKSGEQESLTPDGDSSASEEPGFQLYQQPETEPSESYAVESGSSLSEQGFTLAEEVLADTGESGMEGLGSIFGSVGDFFRGNPGVALALTAGGAYLIYKSTEGTGRGSPAVAGLGNLHSHHRASTKKKGRISRQRVPIYRLQ